MKKLWRTARGTIDHLSVASTSDQWTLNSERVTLLILSKAGKGKLPSIQHHVSDITNAINNLLYHYFIPSGF